MDNEELNENIKRFGRPVAALLVVLMVAFDEFEYLVWGRTAEASVVEVGEGTTTGSARKLYANKADYRWIRYSFTEDDGTPRSEKDSVSPDRDIESGQTVEIEYIPGEKLDSRIKGTGSTWPLVVVGGILLWFGFVVWRFWKQASDELHGRRKVRL